MEAFDVGDYLKSIVGDENFNLEQARARFELAKKKENVQVTAVWALVLAVLFLDKGDVVTAQDCIQSAYQALGFRPEPGLLSLCDYLQEKVIELNGQGGLNP
jgi:hypothetical protein